MDKIYRINEEHIFQVKRLIPTSFFFTEEEEPVLDNEKLKKWKEFLGCKEVLKGPNSFMFCNPIEDLLILEN